MRPVKWGPGPPGITIRGRPVFYGWWVVVASVVLTFLGGGFYIHGFSAFVLPLTEEFNVGRAQIALVFSLAAVSEAVLAPFVGYAVDRFGARRMILAGIPIFALGFFLFSLAPTLLVVFLVVVPILSPGSNSGIFSPMATTVSHWFRRRRSIALSVGTLGFGIGGLLVPFIQFFIDEFDWRVAARAVSIVILAVGLPVAIFLVRNRPEDVGLNPDGEPDDSPEANGAIAQLEEVDFTPREAVVTPAFWGIAFWFMLRMFVVASVSIHFVPLVEDREFSAAAAAGLLSIFAVAVIPSRLILGALADHMPKHLLAAVLGLVQAVALVLLLGSQEFWHLVAFVLVYAVSWGGSGANMLAAIRVDYFGRRSIATIGGLIGTVMMIGAIVGPFATGLVFDKTGSYNTAIWALIFFSVASAIVIFFTRKPAPVQFR